MSGAGGEMEEDQVGWRVSVLKAVNVAEKVKAGSASYIKLKMFQKHSRSTAGDPWLAQGLATRG